MSWRSWSISPDGLKRGNLRHAGGGNSIQRWGSCPLKTSLRSRTNQNRACGYCPIFRMLRASTVVPCTSRTDSIYLHKDRIVHKKSPCLPASRPEDSHYECLFSSGNPSDHNWSTVKYAPWTFSVNSRIRRSQCIHTRTKTVAVIDITISVQISS